MTTSSPDTQDFILPVSPSPEALPPVSSPLQVKIAGLSHPGKLRPKNEDHFLVVRFSRFLECLETNLPDGQVPSRFENIGYAAVADGMGGHAAGEEASRFALAMLTKLVMMTPDWIFRVDEPAFAEEVMRRASDRFEQIDHALAEKGDANPALYGLGTTMTLAANIGKDLFVAHIGDSRAYLFRGGKLHLLASRCAAPTSRLSTRGHPSAWR
jgi:protein phosphatase